MKKKIFILIQLIFTSLLCFTQHCQYCSTSIVGIHPISGASKQIINGLYIFVVNERGIQYNGLNSFVDPVPTDNEEISKTVLFWQNDSTKEPSKNYRKHFSFAHNDYLFRAIWSLYSQKEKDKLYIRIEDRDGEKNGGKFKTEVIPVSQLKLKLLCGYDDPYFKSDDYAPLTIELEAVKARDSTKTIKTANGFRFEFDRSPLSNCPECDGCICKTLQVFNSLEQLVFERVFVENTLERNYHGVDSIQAADYNFDGSPDFRICQYSPQYVYMVFDKDKNTFVDEPLLNQMDNIEFDFTNKIAKASKIITTYKKGGNTMNPNPDRTEEYYTYMLSGKGFNYVQEYINISTFKNNQQSHKKEVNYYFYSQYKLKSVSESEFKKTLSPSSAKEYNIEPFIFKLDKNPAGVEIPSVKGAYAYRIEVLKAKNKDVLFSQLFHGNKLKASFICSDSLQIADFNFDGYTDFRVCALGSMHTYYVYYKKKNTFIEEKRLSELFNVVFDYNKKLVTGNKNIVNYDMGTHTNTVKVSLSAEELSKHKSTDNNNVQQVEPVVVQNITTPKKDSVVVVKPKKDSIINKQPEKQFTKQWKNYQFKLIFNPPDIKPSPVYGSYVKVLEVKDLKKDSIIYSRVIRGDKYKEKAICTDSLLIDDYNFDGYPDYIMCDDYEGKRFTYHLYDSKKNNFVKDNLLSGLINVQLYPDSFKLVGFRAAGSMRQNVWMIGKGFPTVKIFSKIIGDDLVEHNKVNTYIYKEGRLIEINTPIPYKLYSKVKDGYRFQLEFNPDDIKISSDVGSYVKRLCIYKIETNKGEKKVFETSLFANELKETTFQRDSFEIAHYNFDAIPDIRFNNSFNAGQSVYYLSALNDDKEQFFYYEQNLSNLQQIKLFENRKKLSGTYTDKIDFNTVSFYGKYLDTMVVVKQNLNTLAITQTITYLNKLGKLQPIPNIKALEPKPKTKKEFGDYNFDGYEDFRTKKSENDERWDFFIYDSKKQSFELDPLLSKMTYTWFDFENMEFIGNVYTRMDDTSNHTDIYKYFKGKITLYMKKDCVHKSPFSEGSNCVVSELKDGKWVETFVYGAE
ncbi:MAG: hypothetical protein JNJ40_18445 [Bacteroidia bacterium]|nr:hypothetical protein [Bacteroidia bacterium]